MTELSMPRRPARKIAMAKPVDCHTAAITTQ